MLNKHMFNQAVLNYDRGGVVRHFPADVIVDVLEKTTVFPVSMEVGIKQEGTFPSYLDIGIRRRLFSGAEFEVGVKQVARPGAKSFLFNGLCFNEGVLNQRSFPAETFPV